MTIIGNGVDIVDNNRIRKAIKNKKFINRIFTNEEILHAKNKVNKTNFYAKRFAAKEAFLKALGIGIRNDINFKDISIKNNKLGKPMIILNNKIQKIIKNKLKIYNFNIFLSIADENKFSIAFVILNKK